MDQVEKAASSGLPAGFLLAGAVRGLFKPVPDRASFPPLVQQQQVWIEAGAVAAYADICGFSPQQGVPMTWPHVLAFPLQMRIMMDARFPYPAMGMVHLGNRISQKARLNAGDELTLICAMGQALFHDNGQAFSLHTRVQRDGEDIWNGTSIYLKRGVRGAGEPMAQMTPRTGDHKVATLMADQALARRYAKVSGDANPIHTSRLGARLLGFKRPLIHGMWTKARAIAALSPQALVDVAEAEVSFRNPLFLPAKAELYAAQVGAVCDFDCRSPDGTRTHLRGRLSLETREAN